MGGEREGVAVKEGGARVLDDVIKTIFQTLFSCSGNLHSHEREEEERARGKDYTAS